jgi:hypothetical protein
MHLRVEKAQQNAKQVCDYLKSHPAVTDIFFPGAGGCDPKRLAIHQSQADGQGTMISLTTGSVDVSVRFVDSCRIFKTTVSFGSVNSLCEMPCTMSHASIKKEERTLPEDLIRLSIGIEDPLDLIADLEQAFKVATQGNTPDAGNQPYDSKFEDLPMVPNPNPGLMSPNMPPNGSPALKPGHSPSLRPRASPKVTNGQSAKLASAPPCVLPPPAPGARATPTNGVQSENGKCQNGAKLPKKGSTSVQDSQPVVAAVTLAVLVSTVWLWRKRASAA